jgi:hypothetical protein
MVVLTFFQNLNEFRFRLGGHKPCTEDNPAPGFSKDGASHQYCPTAGGSLKIIGKVN